MFHVHSVSKSDASDGDFDVFASSLSEHTRARASEANRADIERILSDGPDRGMPGAHHQAQIGPTCRVSKGSKGTASQTSQPRPRTPRSQKWSEKWLPASDDIAPTRRQVHSSPRMQRLESRVADWGYTSSFGAPNDRLFSQLANTLFFRHGITVVIILGAIQMGLAADLKGSGWRQVWTVWDHFYTGICTAEMIVMIEVYRREYFTTFWMVSDFALAITSILDVWVIPAAGAKEVGFLRILRLIRILRIVKLTKLIPELSIVVEGLFASIRSMFWIFLLLLIIMYAGGILCVNQLGHADAGFPAYNAEPAAVKQETVGRFNAFVYFGTMQRSMATLLGMFLLAEWPIVRQVGQVHQFMVPVFICLLVLVTFGTMNVIIGVVVEKTTKAMNQPRLDEIERQKDEKMTLASTIADMIYSIDTDGDGRISVSELESALGDEKFKGILSGLDLPYGFTVIEFLNMLDNDGSGSLSRHEFVTGIYRLIFCNGWQRDCINAMILGMLHHSVIRKNEEAVAEIKKCHDALRAEIQTAVHLIVAKSYPLKRQSGSGPRSELDLSPRSGDMRTPSKPTITFRSSASVWEPVPEHEVVSIVNSSRDSAPRPQVFDFSSAEPSANKNERPFSLIPSADLRQPEFDEESGRKEFSGGHVVTSVLARETHGDGRHIGDEGSGETGQDGNDENTYPRNLRRNYLL